MIDSFLFTIMLFSNNFINFKNYTNLYLNTSELKKQTDFTFVTKILLQGWFMKKILFSLLIAAVSLFAIDINTATAEEFVKVKGIGEKKAERIVAYRDEHGKFKSVDDLKNVKGIGEKIVEIIKNES